MDLTGRTALVTGSNRGIGRAVLEALAREPLGLLLAGMRSPDKFEEPPVSRAKEVRPVKIDLGSREAIDESVTGLGDLAEEIDLLVNNAGLMTGGLLEEQDLDDIYAMFQVNLLAVVHLTKAVLPGMLERGLGQDREQRQHLGLRVLPGGHHLRRVEGRRGGVHRVAAA